MSSKPCAFSLWESECLLAQNRRRNAYRLCPQICKYVTQRVGHNMGISHPQHSSLASSAHSPSHELKSHPSLGFRIPCYSNPSFKAFEIAINSFIYFLTAALMALALWSG